MADDRSARLHGVAVELAAMAQNGLTYATDRYDLARYVRMRALSADILGLLAGGGVEGNALALIGTGFCGALTTMSTLALEVWDAIIERRTPHAAATLVLHLVLGLGAAWLGWAVAS